MVTPSAAFRGCRPCLVYLTALGWCSVLGCGGPTYQPPALGGTVTWQDGTEPRELEGATLEFESNGTVAAKATLTGDGTFRLDDGIPSGKYRVRVTPPPGSGKPSVLDPRYESFDKSGLEFNATSGPQQANFQLKKRGR